MIVLFVFLMMVAFVTFIITLGVLVFNQKFHRPSNKRLPIFVFGSAVTTVVAFFVYNGLMNDDQSTASQAARASSSQTSSEKKMSSVNSWAKKNHISVHKPTTSASKTSSSNSSKSTSDNNNLKNFEQTLNLKFGQDSAAVDAKVTGTKDKATVIVHGWQSWDNINTNSNKFYQIQMKVIHDVESLADQYGINKSNISYTWNDFNGQLIDKD